MDRVILHCDCNSFFASVETVLNPEYKNVPMAVCGSIEDRHGIVLAKNELAKKYGIKTAETVYSAKKKCKDLVVASPHYKEYVKYSRMVNEIYKDYTDIIEPFGIDESWLDVTASIKLFGSGKDIAEKIRERIKNEVGITVSVGVSFNKVFAKLGSDYKKPDAVTVIDRDNYKSIVYPLPVSDLLFVGKKTALALDSIGIRTIGQLADADLQVLSCMFGKNGSLLLDYATGAENSPVVSKREDAKSISNGFTFKHDILDFEECRIGIDYLAEEIGMRLREEGVLASTVAITLKDDSLRSIQRQAPQNPPTDLAREISKTAFSILQSQWKEGKPIRMITLTATNLSRSVMSSEQLTMFDEKGIDKTRDKNRLRENTVDSIRRKFGNDSIVNGAVIDTDLGLYNKKNKKG
jgi:DNA polymerase-4